MLAIAAGLALLCRPDLPCDRGGRVGDYWLARERADRAGQEIRIAGVCASACTIYLGARRVCVEKSARLAFHGARPQGESTITAAANILLRRMYETAPPRLVAYLEKRRAFETLTFTILTGAQAIALGARACK